MREARRKFFTFSRDARRKFFTFSHEAQKNGLIISCGGGAGPTWEPRAELASREELALLFHAEEMLKERGRSGTRHKSNNLTHGGWGKTLKDSHSLYQVVPSRCTEIWGTRDGSGTVRDVQKRQEMSKKKRKHQEI